MTHAWSPTILKPADLRYRLPEVRWWPHCSACGAIVATVGGRKIYRATPNGAWTYEEPRCNGRSQ